jgi:crotonobetainyl-CoA hydratase
MTAVRTEVDDGILLVTLDRPKVNAIDVATSLELYAAFDRLQRDPALRVAIVTGTGRFFSAGWDLKAGEAIDADHGPGGFAGLTELFTLDKPVIAAVNGLALGGGFELALAADLIVATPQAEFALPEVTLGLVADSGGVVRLPKRLPRAIATELLLTGRWMTAEEAHSWGLVNQVVTDLPAGALTLARRIRAAAPLAISAVKEIISVCESKTITDAYREFRGLPCYQAVLASEDAREGARAFVERRPSMWRGR